MMSHERCSLILFLCWIKTAMLAPYGPMVRYSAVEMGAKVSLVGLKHEQHSGKCKKAWFKQELPIPIMDTEKYTFLESATTLMIHKFSVEDVGSYLFLYSKNTTTKQVIFNLEMVPPQGQHWYEKQSKHVGTVIGMMFLLLIILALVYYCCSKDVDAVFPTMQMRQFTSPHNLQNINHDNIYSGGVSFSPGVHVANGSCRRKTSKEVRRESLNVLGVVSKQNIKKTAKKNKANNKNKSMRMGSKNSSSSKQKQSSPTLL